MTIDNFSPIFIFLSIFNDFSLNFSMIFVTFDNFFVIFVILREFVTFFRYFLQFFVDFLKLKCHFNHLFCNVNVALVFFEQSIFLDIKTDW